MNDDEFFSQFPASPPTEFVDSLRTKLALLDKAEEKAPVMMQTISKPTPSHGLRGEVKRRPRDRYITLVATLILVLFIGTVLTLNINQTQNAVPLAQPDYQVISKENAASLHHIAQIGDGRVLEAVWSPDGRWIFMPGSSGIWVYDAADLAKPLYNIYPELAVYTLVFSNDGQRMAFTSDDGIRLWDLAEQQDVTPEFSYVTSSPAAIALNPDGRVLAIGDYQGMIYFYNLQTGTLLSTHAFDRTRFLDLKFSPDGTEVAFIKQGTSLLILKDDEGTWQKWPIKPVLFSGDSIVGLQALTYSDDGTRLAARTNTTVYIWDTTTGEEVNRIDATNPTGSLGSTNGITNGFDRGLLLSPDGSQLATDGSQIRLWDIETGISQTLYWSRSEGNHWESEAPPTVPSVEASDKLYALSGHLHFNPEWTQLARVSDGVVAIDDIATGKNITYLLNYQMSDIPDVTFSPDGNQLATWSLPRARSVWDISDLSNVPEPVDLQEDIMSMGDSYGLQNSVFSLDNRFIAAYLDNGNIQLWNRDGTEAQQWTAPEYDKKALEFGGFIAYSTAGTRLLSKAPYASLVWLWDTETGKVIQTIESTPSNKITSGALSPDGHFVAVALRSQTIVIYDAATGQPAQSLNGHKAEIRKLVYSPDGKSLVSWAVDGSVYLWTLETGTLAHTLLEKQGNQALAFSPDSQIVIGARTNSVAGDQLFLWDATTGKVLARLPENAAIHGLAFSADGRSVAASLENGTIQIWRVSQ